MRHFLNHVARLARRIWDELDPAGTAWSDAHSFTGSAPQPWVHRPSSNVMIDIHGLPTVDVTRAINPRF